MLQKLPQVALLHFLAVKSHPQTIKYIQNSPGPKIKTYLNTVVEDEMCSTVLSQQAECILIGKVLKLQPMKRNETT